jgi:hypothetical protein
MAAILHDPFKKARLQSHKILSRQMFISILVRAGVLPANILRLAVKQLFEDRMEGSQRRTTVPLCGIPHRTSSSAARRHRNLI